jgi:hypothetical protein
MFIYIHTVARLVVKMKACGKKVALVVANAAIAVQFSVRFQLDVTVFIAPGLNVPDVITKILR